MCLLSGVFFRKYEVSDYVLGKANLLYCSRTAALNRITCTLVGYVIYMYVCVCQREIRDRPESIPWQLDVLQLFLCTVRSYICLKWDPRILSCSQYDMTPNFEIVKLKFIIGVLYLARLRKLNLMVFFFFDPSTQFYWWAILLVYSTSYMFRLVGKAIPRLTNVKMTLP